MKEKKKQEVSDEFLAFVAEATSSKGTSSTTSEARTHIRENKNKENEKRMFLSSYYIRYLNAIL